MMKAATMMIVATMMKAATAMKVATMMNRKVKHLKQVTIYIRSITL
jgi:hypothetical protein